jgi:hypothetical protein
VGSSTVKTSNSVNRNVKRDPGNRALGPWPAAISGFKSLFRAGASLLGSIATGTTVLVLVLVVVLVLVLRYYRSAGAARGAQVTLFDHSMAAAAVTCCAALRCAPSRAALANSSRARQSAPRQQ